ncbi:cold shock CspA family protein [Pseudonocardia hierapolitana]|uniref:Cold shock CspA family protein n=1 Tax=Pseudonocardia hierapolitana TaxID=1128676 RepID=A0A561SKI5_9PSEU|nr:cold shock domain-containing protein [Pseudonocardia hierapolitana]TWF75353.1 cold shock CspA family protein [Pseudonocardia hierapolitana]
MHYGTVAWFDARRGIGMIMMEGSGSEVPVSSAQIDGGGQQSLAADTRVAFRLLHGPGGPRAVDVYVP